MQLATRVGWCERPLLEALAKRGNPASLDTVQLYVYDEKDVVRYTAAAAVLRLTAIREAKAKK